MIMLEAVISVQLQSFADPVHLGLINRTLSLFPLLLVAATVCLVFVLILG